MAFIDDSDLRKDEPQNAPQPQVIYRTAPRGKLVPFLLTLLIIAVLGLATVMALPYVRSLGGGGDKQDQPQVSVDDLDPATLVTPTGRKLDIVQFGGFLFEITRVVYSDEMRARTVVITVPGKPPQMGVFHINDSFAGGKVRIVDITPETVVLEADGKQKIFSMPGADPNAIWDREPAGVHIVPPTGTSLVPDIPAGTTRPPKNPMADQQPADTDQPKQDKKFDSIDDLPLEYPTPVKRDEYLKLIRDLPDTFASDFVLAPAFERETRARYGLEIKNILPTSTFYVHGLQRGDVITAINDQPITSIDELTVVARSNSFRDELRIDVRRDSGLVTFVFKPGVPN